MECEKCSLYEDCPYQKKKKSDKCLKEEFDYDEFLLEPTVYNRDEDLVVSS